MELNLKSILSLVNVNHGWILGHVGLIICLILSILFFSMILIRPDRPFPEQEEVETDDKGLDRLVRHCWGPEVISLKQEVRRISLVRQPCSFSHIGSLHPIISGESPRSKSLPMNAVSMEKKRFPLYQKVVDELVQITDQPLEKVAAQDQPIDNEDFKSSMDSELTGTSKLIASCSPWLTCCNFGSSKSDSSAYGVGHFESDSSSMASEVLETGSASSWFSAAESVDSKTGPLKSGSVKSGSVNSGSVNSGALGSVISESDKAINAHSTPNTAISSKDVNDFAKTPLKMTDENVEKAKLGQLHHDGPMSWRVLRRKKEQINVKLQQN